MGCSCSKGDRLLVFGKVSKSDGFNKNSDIALIGVMKFRSSDAWLKSNFLRSFFTGRAEITDKYKVYFVESFTKFTIIKSFSYQES